MTDSKPKNCFVTRMARRLNGVCLVGIALVVGTPAMAADDALTIWFDGPAAEWEGEVLPIGNGAMGAAVAGGIELERLQFNEKTLWTGGPAPGRDYDYGLPEEPRLEPLKEIQQQLAAKGSLKPETVAEQLGRPVKDYGNYQNFGSMVLNHVVNAEVENYRRELDLARGLASVTFSSEGVDYRREYFASYPDGVIVMRLSASEPGKISFSAGLDIPDNRSAEHQVQKDWIKVKGSLNDNSLPYAAQINLRSEGGQRQVQGNKLVVTGADSAVLILTAGTGYAQKYPDYRGDLPMPAVEARAAAAARHSYEDLRSRHVEDHGALMGRVSLDLGQKMPGLPTPALLAAYKEGRADADAMRALEALYFQFGRYLLISSSRAGSLPANLQGVWNNSNTPPWNADYHVNINLQMNYWPAEVTNLSETTAPLFDFVDSLVEPGRESARKLLGADGWTVFLNTNIWGFTGVIEWPTAFWQPEAGAWLTQHYYEHYLFTGDREFLRTRAYPVMRGAAQVWLDALVKDPRDGKLVVSPSYSPEHGDFTMGAAMSQQIVQDLFINTRAVALELGEEAFAEDLSHALEQLDPGLRVGSWGQLQEWKPDLDDKLNKHRHVSHLFALHPGDQIVPAEQPELASAARTTLDARGDGGTGWAQAWKVNLWARLGDGNRAHKLLGDQLRDSTLPNLWDTHPPFQIDGNFGATAGIAEMLVQSHGDAIHLLPALPEAWEDGRVKGLKARGSVIIEMIEWRDNSLRVAEIKSMKSNDLALRSDSFNESLSLIRVSDQKPVEYLFEGNKISFQADSDERYQLLTNLKED